MISTEIKSNKLSIKHLAKTFYFDLIFNFKSQIKRFGGRYKNTLNFGLSTKTRINYSQCVCPACTSFNCRKIINSSRG